jgi:chemotaxis protein MotA
MDTGALIGVIMSVGFPLFAILIEGNMLGFLSGHATLIVGGGILGITVLSFPLPKVFSIGPMMSIVFFPPQQDVFKTVELLKECSERARREGILILEKIIAQVDDKFLKKAIRLCVDGIDPEVIKETLSNEIAFIEARHTRGVYIMENIANNGPAFAMIGTLIGMVGMLAHMEDPTSIGPNMATALLATLYGAFVAYTLGFPIANRLKELNAEEVLNKELIIEGIMAIQAGDNPRMVEQRLLAFLPSSAQIESE